MCALSASQSRAADSTSVSSTVCRSKVERLIDLEHIGRRRLLLQRFASSACAPAPPRTAYVLDGDDRLVGERLQDGALLAVKWPGAIRTTLIAPIASPPRSEGHDRDRPIAALEQFRASSVKFRRSILNIRNVDHALLKDGRRMHAFAAEREGLAESKARPSVGTLRVRTRRPPRA